MTPRKKQPAARKKSRIIKVDYLARVEGEGALYLRLKDRTVQDVKLKIFEPPRFFEAFLKGRHFTEAPDITARICGICPIAYQMSAINAMERICGVEVEKPIRDLRRLIYCGEWIESHVLHMAMLHAPDFLGYEDALKMAEDHPQIVKDALRMKKIGNELMSLVGGREIHPINMRVGGFYRAPARHELEAMRGELEWALETCAAFTKWASTLEFPDFERDYEFVAMRHPDEYAICEGRLVSNRGVDIDVDDFGQHFREEHVAHSHALQAAAVGRGAYFVGPLARYNLNHGQLTAAAQQTAREAGLGETCANPFKSLLVRGVETVYAISDALRIVDGYVEPERPSVEVEPQAGSASGCTEAPRGICHHTYTIDGDGIIQRAVIVPPTSQNQRTIEEDLWEFLPQYADLSDEDLTWRCEQAVRNYDPCISCATHFLKLHVERE